MRPRLIDITDPSYADEAILGTLARVASVLPKGFLAVQLRDKARPVVSLRLFASRLRLLTKQRGALLFINGDAQLAKDIGADGVHLGGGAMSIKNARGLCGQHAWVSIAAHSDDAVRAAVKEGANAALVSPIFPTSAGPAQARDVKLPRGVDALAAAREITGESLTIYALGGVSADNVSSCLDAGADGVAVIRGILASTDPEQVAKAFHVALSRPRAP